MTDAVTDVVPHHDLREALHVLVVDDLAETNPSSLGLGVHLAILALYDRGSHSEA